MAVHLALKQLQRKFEDADDMFFDIVACALDIWAGAADHLQGYPQYRYTEPTRQLVYAAQRQVQGIGRQPKLTRKTWLVKHLPGISTAMQDSVNSQLDMCIKRLSILQALVSSKQDAMENLLSERMHEEHGACVLVNIQMRMFVIILPISALFAALSHLHARPHIISPHDENPVMKVAWCVGQTTEVREFVIEKLRQIIKQWADMGVPFLAGPMPKRLDAVVTSLSLPIEADIHWFKLAAGLTPNYAAAAQLLRAIHWPSFITNPTLNEKIKNAMKHDLCSLLARSDMLLELERSSLLGSFARILIKFGLTVEDLQAVGMHEEQQQQFKAILEEYSGWRVAWPCSQPSAGQDTIAEDNSVVVGGDGLESSPSVADKSGCSMAANEDVGDLNDMQTLLRMMYGCSKEAPGTCS